MLFLLRTMLQSSGVSTSEVEVSAATDDDDDATTMNTTMTTRNQRCSVDALARSDCEVTSSKRWTPMSKSFRYS